MTTPDQAYFAKNWDFLAAITWTGFQAHGRGAVVVQSIGQRDEAMAGLAGAYDPRREAVVILMKPPSTVTAYKVSIPGRETPPEACRRLSHGPFGGK